MNQSETTAFVVSILLLLHYLFVTFIHLQTHSMLRILSRQGLFCYVIAGSLLCAETASGLPQRQGGGIAVAFLGVKYTNVDPVLQTRVKVGILGTLYQNESLSVVSPDQVAQMVGNDRVEALLGSVSADSLSKLATELNVEYIFTGQLRSIQEDSLNVILEGTLIRYDRAANVLASTKVLRYANEFDQELANLKQNQIDTILPRKSGFFVKYWPILLIGSIAVGGAILIISSNASQSSPGGQSNPPPTTH